MVLFGFSRDKGIKSKLIQWITDGKWSHAWIEYESADWSGLWVAQADVNGVSTEPSERVFKKKAEIVRYEVVDWDMTPGFKGVKSYIGADYDYLTVVWNSLLLILYKITKLGFLWQIVRRDSTKFTCAEFASLAIICSGMPGCGKLDPEMTTASMLLDFCAGSEYFKKSHD